MSLLDTIKGARAEAEEAQGARIKKDEAKATTNEDEASKSNAGFSRKSAARAKPRRELAGSVRTEKKPESQMTKEERKAAREKRRDENDLRHEVAEGILNENPAYKRTQRVWWVCVIVGMVCALGSWLIMRTLQKNGAASEQMAIVSIVLMVLAYVLVIGAFIFDLVKVRPLRNQASDKVSGMTKKRLKRMAESQSKQNEK